MHFGLHQGDGPQNSALLVIVGPWLHVEGPRPRMWLLYDYYQPYVAFD